MATIIEDTRQQAEKHVAKHRWWDEHGVSVVRRKLDVGDYMVPGGDVSVDTKRDLFEVAANVCGRQHARFVRECERARSAGIRLYILVEVPHQSDPVDPRVIDRFMSRACIWCHDRRRGGCRPLDGGRCGRYRAHPVTGPRLRTAMGTLAERHGCEFLLVSPERSAEAVCNLLGVGYG